MVHGTSKQSGLMTRHAWGSTTGKNSTPARTV